MKKIAVMTLVGLISFTGFINPEKETFKVSNKDSKLTWTGKRINYGHTGSVDLKLGELVFENETFVGGSFVIDMKSIRDLDLDDEKKAGKLVSHLKSPDFFDVKTYPETKFKITSVKKENSDKGNYLITGDLTIRNKTNKESFPAFVAKAGNKVSAKGVVAFDRTRYDIRYGSGSFFDDLGDKMIHDEIQISVDLTAYK